MSDKPAMVGNAADEEQVKAATSKARRRELREVDDVRFLLDQPQARRFLARVLEHCGAFRSVMGTTDAMTNYNAGRQDVGHYLLGLLGSARPDAIALITTETLKETE